MCVNLVSVQDTKRLPSSPTMSASSMPLVHFLQGGTRARRDNLVAFGLKVGQELHNIGRPPWKEFDMTTTTNGTPIMAS